MNHVEIKFDNDILADILHISDFGKYLIKLGTDVLPHTVIWVVRNSASYGKKLIKLMLLRRNFYEPC